jgi:hypothetical protein
MRKLMTMIALVVLTQFAMARDNGSILNLRISNNAPFRVFIDGQAVGGVGKVATIDRLSAGEHLLEVYPMGNGRKGHGRSRNFKGMIVLARNTESFVTVYPEYRQVKFDRVVALNNPRWNDGPHHHYQPMPEPHAVAPVGPMPMSQADFQQLKRTIDQGSFESTKLNIFQQALAYNYFTSGQVREVMNLFSFESSKLEVAKIAYPKTLDQNNYYLVNNEFAFSSSVSELGNYIAMR